MKIVFAPDSFKDSLPAMKVAGILRKKAVEIFPGCIMQEIPLADGDKGTIDALVPVLGGRCEKVSARNYLGEKVTVRYGVIREDTMIIETTELLHDSGRMDVSTYEKILFSSSCGIGELIQYGLDTGFRKFYIGAGSSMANDGGMGCAHVLGVRFYDEEDRLLEPSGINLQEIARIDDSCLDKRIQEAEFIVMCSVNNALTGYNGATYVYGAQNGAGPDELLCLERGMRNYARLLEQKIGTSICDMAGTGAAGGLPAALAVFCKARLTSGISTMLKLIDFDQIVENASLVVVGEGMLDQTTVYGKTIAGIGMMCKAKGIPVVAVVGAQGKGAEQIYHYGVSAVISMVNAVMGEDYIVENAEELLAAAAENMFRFLASGMQMQVKEDCLSGARIHLGGSEDGDYSIHWDVDPDMEDASY